MAAVIAPKKTVSSFAPAALSTRVRTIGRSYGEVGTGKTQFWLLAPKPLYVQSMDQGLEGTIDQLIQQGLVKAGDIHVAEYDWNSGGVEFDQPYAIELRDRLANDYLFALNNGARTILWDKESDIWELHRFAQFGKPNDTPKDYVSLNARYAALINKAKGYDVSLGLIQSVKEEWGATGEINQRTGKKAFGKTGHRKPWGYDRLEELVFVNIEHTRIDGQFGLNVGKCRQATSLQDQSLPGMTFAEFGTLLIDGSTIEDWA